ncbi:ABSCISIC ACID-INSENSITIVE 5-like protein 2 [Malania oleifera]|uniref:ABSCISIC ACID-INSENSITIVE 5-like protein 2 n=1 Tax=Malania oleifera TaxID=397392 RepID=UPI0025AE2999|nr:ABSCISIC ACID-INSENSITIVE 5-like protein 2 [Malania oleifera]XP_057953326.1 ABSCISIC ACID-INSENSITIVE 5-like protein 2 [Malania oleifera]XP_057953328.1 ABSCISIC ACID-INSENSITIVE 5-like protein 2 [Malania oleifera]XP_057953329.1 ABSCISIC ACID-INSENSITIVE 5-like protein 2 [Malania oleifera]XP_057953330.1 ABSCISIC ACID-INSENSITIVE 5-like protein 2 [Malania oleifera]XP_057953331.1 ABSCISIC ACID-INSENSITIVE 5-like protein 2 [Malania oleifera]XP_057953332.1 ABSCISIC ACID-INSENSITIVE 5-like prote
MGIQTMGIQGGGQQSHVQPLTRQNSWYNLTLDEVENQLAGLGKPLGSMNLDEVLKNVWSAGVNPAMTMDVDNTSPASLQRQASLSLARALSEKTVDEVWRDIQQGQQKKGSVEMKGQERETTLGEMTLEDFLVKAAVFAEGLDTASAMTPQGFPRQMGLLQSPSIGTQLDAPLLGRKRDTPDTLEKTVERRLRRKIKNRESAARSRARKQAYHNELVSKVSHLEEENIKLRKEKELEEMLPYDSSPEPKYQLRRTSSASF